MNITLNEQNQKRFTQIFEATFNTLMPGGYKIWYILKQTYYFYLQIV